MFKSTKTYGHDLGLSCCFRQWRAASHCRYLHGYPLSFKFVFSASELDENNWVVDFGSLKWLKQDLTQMFDHTLIIAKDDPKISKLMALGGMGLAQPVVLPAVGCEAVADYVFAATKLKVEKIYGGRVKLESVEVREHGANSAIREAD